jgi:hypothetical protein
MLANPAERSIEHFPSISVYPKMMEVLGVPCRELSTPLIPPALDRYRQGQIRERDYSSEVRFPVTKSEQFIVSESGPLCSTRRTSTMRADTSQKGDIRTFGWRQTAPHSWTSAAKRSKFHSCRIFLWKAGIYPPEKCPGLPRTSRGRKWSIDRKT